MSSSGRLTLGPVVAEFFETYLCHTKGDLIGTPLVLEPWQLDFLNEFYRVDEQGNRLYRHALFGVPRGNGKTPLAAGIGLFELMTRTDAPEIYNIAGAEHQAQDLTDFSTAFVDRGLEGAPGKLQRWLTAHKKAVTNRRTHGTMKLLSSAGSLQHGKSLSVAIADELHAFKTEDQVESYIALVTALHKRRNAFTLIITTAGYAKKGSLLGDMYTEALATYELEERNFVDGVGPCLTIGRDLENQLLFWWYGPPDDPDLDIDEIVENEEVWAAVNPAGWFASDAMRLQRHTPGVDEYDFARLHLNMWTQAKEVFIPMGAWRRCRSPEEPRRKAPTFLAVDAGLTHDTSAVSWSQPVIVEQDGKQVAKVVNRARIWSARPEHELDRNARHVFVPGGRMELELLFDFIVSLSKTFSIRELVYDLMFFEGEAQRLGRLGIKCAPIYQAGVLPEVAYQQFYQDVLEGKALHGDDRVLNSHIAAAFGIKTERGWRVSELNSEDPIDGLQAVSMSHWRASRQSASVYEERGLRTLGDWEEDDEDEDD